MTLYIAFRTLKVNSFFLIVLILCPSGIVIAERGVSCKSAHNKVETRSGETGEVQFPSVSIENKSADTEDGTIWKESHLNEDSSVLTPSNGSGQVVSLALVCTASYPVQWSFAKYQKWIPWSVQSGRVERPLETRDVFQSWLRYPLMRNITQIRNDLPTCHKSSDECIQTSVTVNSTSLLIRRGSDLSLNPDAQFGKNVGCKLRIAYDEDKKLFYCHSLEPNVTLTMFPVPCSDPIDCRSIYMDSVEPCSSSEIKPYRGCKDCVKMSYPIDYLPGAAVCLVRGLTDDEATLNASVAVPFFYSLTNNNSSLIPQRYLNWDEIRGSEMMEMTKFKRMVYAGETISINCNASYYYFGSGVQIDVHKLPQLNEKTAGYPGFSEEDSTTDDYTKGLDLEGATSLSGEDASSMGLIKPREELISQKSTRNAAENNIPWIRSITADIKTRNPGSYKIQCRAPVWNSTTWVSKFTFVTILPSTAPKFLNGNKSEKEYYKPELKLVCSTIGVPKPVLEWNQDGRPLPLSIKISREEEDGNKSSSTLTLPSTPDGVYGKFACVAYNPAGVIQKEFSVIPSDPDSSTLMIILGIFGIIAMILVPTLFFLVWKVNQQKKQLRNLTEEEVEEFIMGKPDYIPFQSDMSTYAYYLPYDKSFEIAKEDLEIDYDRVLGQGAYGMVLYGKYKTKASGKVESQNEQQRDYEKKPGEGTFGNFIFGKNRNQSNGSEKIEVAVKMSKPLDNGIDMFKALLSELKIMTYIGRHDNIVNLVGACTQNIQKREVFIALEFCDNGSLLSYLRINRHSFLNPAFEVESPDKPSLQRQPSFISQPQVHYVKMEDLSQIALHSPREYANTHRLMTADLMRWAHEIAEGMSFLASKKVIHGDLAARNVLLTANRTAKVGDFGLSKRLMHYNSYTRTASTPLPIKWLALECLQDSQFSVESDVWSYGVTLWEIFSLGEVPYSGFNGTSIEFLNNLSRGMRLSSPTYCSPEIFDVMMKCWRNNRKQRPSFEVLSGYFQKGIPSAEDESSHPALVKRLSRMSSILLSNGSSDYPALINEVSDR